MYSTYSKPSRTPASVHACSYTSLYKQASQPAQLSTPCPHLDMPHQAHSHMYLHWPKQLAHQCPDDHPCYKCSWLCQCLGTGATLLTRSQLSQDMWVMKTRCPAITTPSPTNNELYTAMAHPDAHLRPLHTHVAALSVCESAVYPGTLCC